MAPSTSSSSSSPLPSTPAGEIARAVGNGELARALDLLRGVGTLYGLPGRSPEDRPQEGGGNDEGRTGDPGNRRQGRAGSAGALTAEGDFVPFYFTDPDLAVAYAREHDFIGDAEETAPLDETDPIHLLRTCLDRGYGGLVIDPGTAAPAAFAAVTLSRLLDVAAAEGTEGGRGPRPSPDRDAHPEAERPESRYRRKEGRKEESPKEQTRKEEDGTSAADFPPPPHALDLAERVRRSPDLDVLPPPDTESAEAGALLQELRHLWAEDRIPLWELVDTLAFGIAFHVPVSPQPTRGLRWPLLVRHPRNPEKPTVWIFTDPDRAREALPDSAGEVEILRLSGLEAFRWVWGTPTPVSEIVVDLAPASQEPFFLPDVWALSALYPHFLDCPDLERVRRVPLHELGDMAGARGAKPECVRALVEGGAELVLPDPLPAGVEHDGGRYLPVFSSMERYRSWAGSDGPDSGPDADPDAEASGSPPFRRWLLASTSCSGVLLDPGSVHPLPLDHADLAILALRAEGGAQPGGDDLAGLVADLREPLGPRVAGRILAEWPRWFWALQAGGEGEPTRAMTLPGRDACPVFTTDPGIREFLERLREKGLVAEEMRPLLYLTGWAFNVFREMHARYRHGGWIDPDAAAVARALDPEGRGATSGDPADESEAARKDRQSSPYGGLEVDTEMVRAALARIEWRLQPRIPGFLAEP